ncbi:YjbF family lipoprotein [Alphaproteobacteria bacterium KMM 3653]|uniref:YjbF family lipoprotein n=1 Tax=Harenicola maris TaxID=2841044 RepID=A0AAP2CS58_9RHOB|nr:YjbF family lipoprotein [Harenicola maris]
MKRIFSLIACFIFGLSGCAAVTQLASGEQELDPRFERLFNSDAPKYSFYAQSSGVRSVLVLLERGEGTSTWIGPFGEGMIVRDGMIIGTRGFGEGLIAVDLSEVLPLILNSQMGQAERFHSYHAFGTQTEVRAYVCDVTPMGTGTVLRGAQAVSARTVEEDCTGPSGDFINKYWIASGEVIQSRQWVGPRLGSVTIGLQEND